MKTLITGIVAGIVLSVAGYAFLGGHADLPRAFMTGLGIGLGIIVGLGIINKLIQSIDMMKTRDAESKGQSG